MTAVLDAEVVTAARTRARAPMLAGGAYAAAWLVGLALHPSGPALDAAQLASATSTLRIDWTLWLLLVGTFALHYMPRALYQTCERTFVRLPAPAQGLALAIAAALLSLVASAEAVPFIYFQF